MARIDIRSEVTGRIWRILAEAGARVADGEPVVLVEAMKMEIPVAAPRAGTVAEILVAEGDEVAEDQVVARLETDA